MDAAGRLSLSIRELSERHHFRCRHIRRDVWRKPKSEVRAISAFRIDSELRLLFGRIMTGDEHRESQQFVNRIFAIPLSKSGLTPNGNSHHYSNPSRSQRIGWSKGQPKRKNRRILFDCRNEAQLLCMFCFVRLPVVQTDLRARSQRILAGSRYLCESLQPYTFILHHRPQR